MLAVNYSKLINVECTAAEAYKDSFIATVRTTHAAPSPSHSTPTNLLWLY